MRQRLVKEPVIQIDTSLIKQHSHSLVVGVSGGMDSCALLHLLMTNPVTSKKDIKILHVNYGLRGEQSDQDQKLVEKLAHQYQVKIEIIKVEDTQEVMEAKRKLVTQAWAREVRYQYFQKEISQGSLVVLAHHQDDVAESVLLRIAKGQNLRKLAGMSPLFKGVWRPLLGVSRAEIEDYVRAKKLEYREDESNQETYYERNFVRHEVVPRLVRLNPQARRAVSDFAIGYQSQMTLFHQMLAEKYHFQDGPLLSELADLEPVICEEVLAAFFAHLGHSYGSRNFLRSVVQRLKEPEINSIKMQMNKEFYLLAKEGRLRISPLDESQKSAQIAHFEHSKATHKKLIGKKPNL